MRAVKTNSFIWAAVIIVIGFDPRVAIYAAILGLLFSVAIPIVFSPKVVPARNHEQGHHAGTLYKLEHRMQPRVPVNQQPGDNPANPLHRKHGEW